MDRFSPRCPNDREHGVSEVIRKRFHPSGDFIRFGAWFCAGCEKDVEPVFASRVIADFESPWPGEKV